MNHSDEKKSSVVIRLKDYQEAEQKWFEESLERPVVVVDEEGERLFSMELVKVNDESTPAAAGW